MKISKDEEMSRKRPFVPAKKREVEQVPELVEALNELVVGRDPRGAALCFGQLQVETLDTLVIDGPALIASLLARHGPTLSGAELKKGKAQIEARFAQQIGVTPKKTLWFFDVLDPAKPYDADLLLERPNQDEVFVKTTETDEVKMFAEVMTSTTLNNLGRSNLLARAWSGDEKKGVFPPLVQAAFPRFLQEIKTASLLVDSPRASAVYALLGHEGSERIVLQGRSTGMDIVAFR